jgi:DnaJ-class molecular chaperone
MVQGTSRHNYYEILELKAGAPQHEVTTAYERARHTYSGENTAIYTIFSEQEAREFLSLIEEAYEILGNKTLRMIYDQRLRNGQSSLNDLTYAAIIDASKQMQPEVKQERVEPTYKRNEAFEKEMATNSDWDGEALKKVREYKNLTLRQMNEITKINSYYVGAIERMEAKELPAIVFVRGYVVQIAKALGLDEKKVADSYMKNFKVKIGN